MSDEKETHKFYSSIGIKILLLFATVALIVLMFPKGESIDSNVTVNSIWTKNDLIASVSFPVLLDKATYEKKKLQAAKRVYRVFVKKDSVAKKSLDSLRSYNNFLLKTINNYNKTNTLKNINPTFLSQASFDEFKRLHFSGKINFIQSEKTLNNVFAVSKTILRNIYRRGLLNIPFDEIPNDTIAIRQKKFEKIVRKAKFLSLKTVSDYVKNYLMNYFSMSSELNDAVYEYITHFISPNLIFSKKLTDEAIKIAEDKVPRTLYIVRQNERIVAKHDRITKAIKLRIDSYRIAKGESISTFEIVTQEIGKSLHILLILIIFIVYLYLFRKKIFFDNKKLLLIAIIFLFPSFIAYLIQQMDIAAPMQFLILIPVVSIMLTIIFDSRLGFYGTVVVSLIVGALRGNDYVFAVTNIFAGGLAAYSVRDIKNRSQIFRSFIFILIGYIISIMAFGFERFSAVQKLVIEASFAASNALISPVLTYGFIIFIERLFGITTDLTLLELTDFNSPLLKELARNAPGTFNHSMTIGSMVESAASAIGANPLLARVGAYYHDIGKSLDPESFVENQTNKNIHEDLNPRESAKIIMKHVENGIELAKEKKLPQEIVDFIPMHHGTLTIYYFYKKAKEILGEEKVSKEEFRYPGPKPNTKETALVMLADACESTVRSMDDLDQQKVENIINNLFKIRIEDGQLDEAPLTFNEITKIKSIFLNILLSQHHKRIRYPKQDEMENEPLKEKG